VRKAAHACGGGGGERCGKMEMSVGVRTDGRYCGSKKLGWVGLRKPILNAADSRWVPVQVKDIKQRNGSCCEESASRRAGERRRVCRSHGEGTEYSRGRRGRGALCHYYYR
jgi:hypothetical protein